MGLRGWSDGPLLLGPCSIPSTPCPPRRLPGSPILSCCDEIELDAPLLQTDSHDVHQTELTGLPTGIAHLAWIALECAEAPDECYAGSNFTIVVVQGPRSTIGVNLHTKETSLRDHERRG